MDEKERKKEENPGLLVHLVRGSLLELLMEEDQDEKPVRPIWAKNEQIEENAESSETKAD